jgi:lipoprotein-anchoring transpeptidase ErfK/SrfK
MSGKLSRRTKIIALVTALVLGFGTAAAWGYDQTQKETIARGISIDGVAVGGMEPTQARQKINARILEPQQLPLVVRSDGGKFVLPADKLKVRADVAGAVDQAVEASRTGNLATRLFRRMTGSGSDTEIDMEVTWSRPALTKFVAEVAAKINRDPIDATVEPGPTSLTVVDGKDGLKLRDRHLDSRLAAILDEGSSRREVKAKTMVLKPGVTRNQVKANFPTYLTVDRSGYTLRLWKNLKVVKTYSVAVGKIGYETPAGLYSIQNKQVDPPWTAPDSDWAAEYAGKTIPGGAPDNPLKARWLGVNGSVGIHGTGDTGSLSSAASHGCIRMSVPEVIELYDQVPVGTPVYIG